jgi:hypothetical protein
MSTLRNPLKYLDFIMDKKHTDVVYMVLHEEMHNVWVIKHGGGEPPKEIPKRLINMVYIKCDPKVVDVLFSERKEVPVENVLEATEPSFE